MTPNTIGALLMMGSMASFTINDTFIKMIGTDLPLMQLLLLRGLLTSALIYIAARRLGALRLRLSRKDWGLIALRCFGEVTAAYFFLQALINMPLANVTAILQVLPLTVSLGAALFLGESFGWRRLVAILIGFAGMLLIVRPGPDGFSIWSVYALIAVAGVTLRDLATRRISAEVPSLTVTMAAAVAVVAFAGVGSLSVEWQPVTPRLAVLILGAACFVLGGYFFSVQVMRQGEIAFIAPFRYTSLIFALVLGFVVFGDWPDPLTLAGAGVVVATGLFTLYRERVSRRA